MFDPIVEPRVIAASVGRAGHLFAVVVLAAFIVLPVLPKLDVEAKPPGLASIAAGFNLVRAKLAHAAGAASVKQSWNMYSPNPQRALVYLNITAHYPDGSERRLQETVQEQAGWDTNWMWDKTRVDIWRQYAAFHGRRGSRHRTWYLRGVCVRETRRGAVPTKLTLELVKRRFTAPELVAQGRPALGPKQHDVVSTQYCRNPVVNEMIANDRARRGEPAGLGSE
jgi:hypothetical protein